MNFGLVFLIYIVLIVLSLIFFRHRITEAHIIFFVILLGLISFNARPIAGMFFDTERFNIYLEMIRQLNHQYGSIAGLQLLLHQTLIVGGIGYFGNYNLAMYASQPFVELVMWFFSLFPQNGYLRLAVVSIFCFSIIAVIRQSKTTIASQGETTRSWEYTLLTFVCFLGLFNIFFEIEGLRNFLAFSLAAWAIGRHLLRQKVGFISVILWAFAVLIHPAAVILLALYLLYLVVPKRMYWLLIAICLVYQLLSNRIIKLFNILSQYVPVLSGKVVYFGGSSNYSAYASKKEILITTCLLLILCTGYYIFSSSYSDKKLRSYLRIVLIYLAFTIGSFFSMQLYLRLIQFDVMLLSPLIYYSLVIGSQNLPRGTVSRFIAWMFLGSGVMLCAWLVVIYRFVLVF